MKVLCRVDLETSKNKFFNFQPFKVVVDYFQGKTKEVVVDTNEYGDKKIRVTVSRIAFYPKSLTVDASGVSAPELLLAIEICKFVADQYPEIYQLELAECSNGN